MFDTPSIDRRYGLLTALVLPLVAALVGHSPVAGLFLLPPLLFVVVLLRTAIEHYLGTPAPTEASAP